jgi:hypothetical protein
MSNLLSNFCVTILNTTKNRYHFNIQRYLLEDLKITLKARVKRYHRHNDKMIKAL